MSNRIKELRKVKGLSQKELANLIGVSVSAIGMYEQLRRQPDNKTLLKLAKVFDVSIDYLIMASNNAGRFNIEKIASDVANDIMGNDALMFNSSFYTDDEITQLKEITKKSVIATLKKHLKE